MRADRLVAVLLLLQRRGRVTSAEVAAELEVSERTARRDLEALGLAGLPVYAVRGRGGGWSLAGGGRTDLSGLTEAEVRTLFLLAGPSPTAGPELRAALRKLVRALPESFRATAEAAAGAVVVDRGGWGSPGARPDPPHLDTVQQAVVQGRQAVLDYTTGDGRESRRVVHPLGLAVRGTTWYLVADTDRGRRTFRVDRVRAVELLDRPVVRPEGFDLGRAWHEISADVDERRAPVRARATVSPDTLTLLRWVLGRRVRIGPAGAGGRVEVEVRGASAHALAGELAGFGSGIEVLEPSEVRHLLGRIGGELHALYGGGPPDGASARPPDGAVDEMLRAGWSDVDPARPG